MIIDDYYMNIALDEARKAAQKGEIPVGAIIVCNDTIIARAHNLTQTLNDVTAHAEILSITAAANRLGSKYLNSCTLYVSLEPCIMCAGAIGWAQIGRLVYGASDAKRGYSLFTPSPLHPRTKVESGIKKEQCAELITDFLKRRR